MRYYRQAAAQLSFGTEGALHSTPSEMRDERRTVCLTKKEGKDFYYSPLGAFTREELELVDTPTSRVDLIGLLPGRKLRLGESWKHDSDFLAHLLNLDTVGASDVRGKLDSVSNGIAVLSSEGTVDGAVDSAATEIKLKASYKFDLKSRRIISLTLAFHEKREVTQTEPGFDVVTKLAMAETSMAKSEELSADRLVNLDLSLSAESAWLQFTTKHGGFELLLDPRWKVLFDQPSSAVFRYVDAGELTAQVNLIRMKPSETEAAISLEEFSAQASKALAENFGQLIESKQYASPRGNRVLRVEATGVNSEVDMRWVYYHVSSEEGKQITCVMTCQEEDWKTFAPADESLVNRIELVDLPEVDEEPTPAKTARKPE